MAYKPQPLDRKLNMKNIINKMINKKNVTVLAKGVAGLMLLGIIVHTIAVIATGNHVRRAKENIKAAGYQMSLAEIIPPPLEESKNAAVELKKIFGLLTLGSNEMYSPGGSPGKVVKQYEELLKFYKAGSTTPYSDKQLAELEELFSKDDLKRIFQLLSDAASKKEARFQRQYFRGPGLPLPEMGHHRSVCRMLAIRAQYEAQVGNKVDALRLVREGLIVGELMKTEPILMSQLARLANLKVSLEALRFVSARHELTDSELESLNQLLIPYADAEPMIRGINGERVLFGQWFFEERHTAEGSWLIGTLPNAAFFRLYHWYPFRPVYNVDHSSYLNHMLKQLQFFKVDLSELTAEEVEEVAQKKISRFALITPMVASSLEDARIRLEQSRSLSDMTMIAIACNQYRHRKGSYPEVLDDLGPVPTEKATGKPYNFQKTEDAIYIYSGYTLYNGSLTIDLNGKENKLHGVKITTASVPDKEDSLKRDQAAIQGKWKVVAMKAAGNPGPDNVIAVMKYEFKGNRLIITPAEPGPGYTFKLDPSSKPTATLDITPVDSKKPDDTMKGIYVLVGDQLKLCLAKKKRPTEMRAEAKDGFGQMLIELQREKP